MLFKLVIASLIASAQAERKAMEFGLLGGIFVYQGDLTPSRFGSFRTLQPGGELYAEKPISHLFSVRLNLAASRLKGDDSRYAEPEWRQERSFVFSSPVVELSALFVSRVPYKGSGERKIDPYLFAGVGLSWVNIDRDWSSINLNYFGEEHPIWQGIEQDSAYNLRSFVPAIPLGAGFNYAISDQWAIALQGTYRFTFTDYLDGFSRSANPGLKDSYFSATAGIVYRPGRGKDLKCPTVGY
jgi:hypothetical protein